MSRLLAKLIMLGTAAVIVAAAVHGGPDRATAVPPRAHIPYAVEYRGMSDVKFKNPVNDVGYECGSLTVPAGAWRLSYRAMVYSSRPETDTGTVSAFAILVPTVPPDAAQADAALSRTGGRVGGNSFRAFWTLSTSFIVTLAKPATFHLLVYQSEGGNWDSLQCTGERSWTIIRAERL